MHAPRFNEWKGWADDLGSLLIETFHYLALFVIGASIVWSAVIAYAGMVSHGHATIDDILLLFIYLELGAMVGIYFKTSVMPVRLIISLLPRYPGCCADIQAHQQADMACYWCLLRSCCWRYRRA